MYMKIMRPTNVRASVGSSASGSSARPIVSVPPFFRAGGGLAEVAAATAVSETAPTASARSALRARKAVIAFPLLWMQFPLDVLPSRPPGFPGRCRDGQDPTKWIQLAGKWIHELLRSPRRHGQDLGYSSRRPPRGDDPGARAVGRIRLGLAAPPRGAGQRVRRVADAGAGGPAQAPGLRDRSGRAEPRRDGQGSQRTRG